LVEEILNVLTFNRKIRDSNRSTLIAALRELGGVEVIDLGIAGMQSEDFRVSLCYIVHYIGDTRGELESRLNQGLESADVVVTSGGVSMGDLDLIQPILEERGKVHFGRVLMKPGKPLTFATMSYKSAKTQSEERKLVFGLPGNPVSSIVTFYLSVVPSIRSLIGYANPHLAKLKVTVRRCFFFFFWEC